MSSAVRNITVSGFTSHLTNSQKLFPDAFSYCKQWWKHGAEDLTSEISMRDAYKCVDALKEERRK